MCISQYASIGIIMICNEKSLVFVKHIEINVLAYLEKVLATSLLTEC